MNLSSICFKLKSYIRLARLNQPVGIFLLLWPTLWGICASTNGQMNRFIIFVFCVGVITMRSAGCVINDYFDRNIDGKVKRTKTRPLATGHISQIGALIFFILLLLASATLLFFLNVKTFWCALFIVPFVLTYPIMKRYTFLPQLYLAFTFSWGIPMAYFANNADIDLIFFHLFLASMTLVLIYDTQYALADKKFDIEIGVKSSALLFEEDTSLIISILQVLFIFLIFQIGLLEKLNHFFIIALVIVMIIFYYQHRLIQVKTLESFIKAFKSNNIIGLVIFCGLFIGYYMK